MKSELSKYASTISPNKNTRNQPITKITIHHMAANVDADEQARRFANKSRQASHVVLSATAPFSVLVNCDSLLNTSAKLIVYPTFLMTLNLFGVEPN